MKRAITVALACSVAVLVPAVSGIADNGNGNGNTKNLAKKECNALKNADKGAFRAVHGKHAMRNCKRDAKSELADEHANAAQECRAEQESDPAGFQETWGTNEPKGEQSKGTHKNAFGKCVSGKVRDEVEEDVEDFDNAAQQCRAERDEDPALFQENWGTNEPKGEKSKGAKRNAFGKCVSATARDSDEDGEGEPTA